MASTESRDLELSFGPDHGTPGASRNAQHTKHPVRRGRVPVAMQFTCYEVGEFFDEMFAENGQPRACARTLVHNIQNLADGELVGRQRAAERALLQMGITFNVYGERAGAEKIFPFDLVPRIVPAAEWSRIERGLKQRITALNQFIHDLYHDQKILK